jgi:hypothetical protein
MRWNRISRGISGVPEQQLEKLDGLVQRQRVLARQRASLAGVRRLLGIWHVVHVPLGLALFAAAIVHIIGAIYYASLLR